MVISDPRDALVVAHAHGRHLREEAAAGHMHRASGTRRALAASLRRVAHRLDSTPFAPRPA